MLKTGKDMFVCHCSSLSLHFDRNSSISFCVYRLCQCEIAKRACTLVRNVTQLQRGESAVWSTALSQLIAQLPLPEDYAQQELQQLLNAYTT